MARTRNQGSKWIRPAKRLAIYLRDGCTCTYCGRAVLPMADATLDHVLACELGGSNSETNLVTACLSCNSSKGAMSMRKWLAHLRNSGVNTKAIPARVSRRRGRALASFRKTARKAIETAGGYTAACKAMQPE